MQDFYPTRNLFASRCGCCRVSRRDALKQSLLGTALLLAQLLPKPVQAADTPRVRRYTVMLASRPVGVQTTEILPGGEWRISYEYNDRGRGPKLVTRLVLGPDRVPVLTETTGNDYYKGSVTEVFNFRKGRANWRNNAEQGERGVPGKAFYTSFHGPPEENALLAQALLGVPGNILPLLPEGEARLERVGELKLNAGGKARTVVHYQVSGLDLSPSPIWLDEDGTFFGIGGEWWAVMREGWEASLDDLTKAENAVTLGRERKLALELATRPGLVAFTGANLFDSETATLKPGTTVLVEGERIRAVGPDGMAIPGGTRRIDASGKTLLPGLWDMHAHLSANDNRLNLACGVTSIRDMANDIDYLQNQRQSFDSGETAGPRIVAAGFIDGPGPYAGPSKVLVATAEEGRKAVARYAELGYEQIKLYSSLKPELIEGLIREGHERGMRVSGHVPAFMSAEQVIKLGFDEIQHINFVFLNFLFDSVKDTRTPVRFTAVAQNAAELDLRSERVQAFVSLLKEHKTVIDPTVNVFEQQFVARRGVLSPSYAAVANRMPPQLRRSFLAGGLPVPDGQDRRYRDSFGALLAMIRLLHESGVPLVAGTDALAGFALHRELELYVQAGIPAPEVLKIATLGAARVARRERELGSIAPGKLADLVLVAGNPAADISAIRQVEMVVKGGTVYHSADLCRSLGIQA
ncbi:MAG: amidohydrolase family protein [Gemmatimonadaceae bacterium]|nr:amidohydrolase family protein [Gloeobacterales cyanobacterium ES-bin-141]